MIKTMCAAILLAIPSLAFGDGLATSICVLSVSKVESLLKDAGTIGNVPTGQLWEHSAYHEYIGKKPGDSISAEFTSAHRELRLLATRIDEGKVLYSIRDVTVPGKEVLVGAGSVVPLEGMKKDIHGETFVVVLRGGNFELK